MKKTAITAIILSLLLSIGTTAAAQSETSMAATTRPSMAAPSDYVPEPQEEIITEYAAPIGEQGRGSIKNLEYHYHNNGYPEYISYIAAYDKVLIDDNTLAVCIRAGLTDMSQENMDEILALADSSCYIVFEQASYSYNERQKIYAQLREEFPDVYVSLGYDNESIIIYTPDGKEEAYLEALNGRYEGLVYVAGDDGVLYDAAIGEPTGEHVTVPDGGLGVEAGGSASIGGEPVVIINKPTKHGNILIIAAVAAAVMLIVGATFLFIRHSRIKLGADGTASATATLTKKDIMKLISDSAETPSDELKDRII